MRMAMLWFLVLVGCLHSSPIPQSDDTSSPPSIGRTLLQLKKPCPVNFEFMNYTIITSRCRGPRYPADLCCPAFKEFACPYSRELNDLSNDCSTIMFSYINHYGNYPPGVFSSLCHDDDVGLVCDSVPPGPATGGVADDSGVGRIIRNGYLQLVVTTCFQVLLFWWI
ncbi:putative GPI-anchored protein LORELEI [Helianthus annuus]|uniref:GPI-anchored protein LORELEI n=1 Tax=Helianthus annuus TaxID=4232 RepID=A0A251STA6_HELAN|nr:GPI-anchored protein LLG1 [Helianthus annuus]KAF5773988.1 putative GPI-anchored protein LORELEI [Helianthus annuus]KAJ0481859.1 putative GPI-anchored protein LORELEI [Helianthus annuus]KAJ0849797.1 putative GPI-anchored protein LORELEI [Helianthus annuus]